MKVAVWAPSSPQTEVSYFESYRSRWLQNRRTALSSANEVAPWRAIRRGVGADGSRVRREGYGLGVVLAGGQAVVELAEEAVEQVAQRGGVPVAGHSAAVVVRPCPG